MKTTKALSDTGDQVTAVDQPDLARRSQAALHSVFNFTERHLTE